MLVFAKGYQAKTTSDTHKSNFGLKKWKNDLCEDVNDNRNIVRSGIFSKFTRILWMICHHFVLEWLYIDLSANKRKCDRQINFYFWLQNLQLLVERRRKEFEIPTQEDSIP